MAELSTSQDRVKGQPGPHKGLGFKGRGGQYFLSPRWRGRLGDVRGCAGLEGSHGFFFFFFSLSTVKLKQTAVRRAVKPWFEAQVWFKAWTFLSEALDDLGPKSTHVLLVHCWEASIEGELEKLYDRSDSTFKCKVMNLWVTMRKF
eukprot:XP_027327295.1 uncharacterized protein LOC110351401 isoform X2 [Anas platyrhynchos]